MADHVPPPVEIPATLLADLTKMGLLLDVGSQAYQLALQMLQHVHQDLAGQAFGSDFRMLAYVLFAKAFMTFQSIRNLCLMGCGPDALGLCASLFENLVDFKYIRQAPVRRARRYIQFEQVDKYYQTQKILQRKRLPRGTRNRYRKYSKFIAPQVAKLLKVFSKQGGGWSGKSLRDRAKAVKLDLEYDELYFIFCGVKHTLPMGAAGFVFEHEAGVDVVRGPNIKGVYLSALHSTHYLLRICDLFQDAYHLAAEATELRPITRRLIQAADTVKQEYPKLCS